MSSFIFPSTYPSYSNYREALCLHLYFQAPILLTGITERLCVFIRFWSISLVILSSPAACFPLWHCQDRVIWRGQHLPTFTCTNNSNHFPRTPHWIWSRSFPLGSQTDPNGKAHRQPNWLPPGYGFQSIKRFSGIRKGTYQRVQTTPVYPTVILCLRWLLFALLLNYVQVIF